MVAYFAGLLCECGTGFWKTLIPELLLFLHEFEDVIARNNPVGEKAVDGVCFLLIAVDIRM